MLTSLWHIPYLTTRFDVKFSISKSNVEEFPVKWIKESIYDQCQVWNILMLVLKHANHDPLELGIKKTKVVRPLMVADLSPAEYSTSTMAYHLKDQFGYHFQNLNTYLKWKFLH